MNIYAVKFREKGEKAYKTVLILAKDENELGDNLKRFFNQDIYDVDKRTISWAGNSIPFMSLTSGRATVIYADLDEIT
jgi:hypothetical protein